MRGIMMLRYLLPLLLACFSLFGAEVRQGAQVILDEPVSGNLYAIGGIIEVTENVRGNAYLVGGQVRIGGTIEGNLRVYAGEVQIDSQAVIKGNFTYSSPDQAQIDPGAKVEGIVTFHPLDETFKAKWKKTFFFGARMTGLLMNFLFSFVIGWILLKMFPQRAKKAVEILRKKPWKAFGIGLVATFLLPIACLFLFITILGFPLGLALLALSLLGFYTAKIFPILWLGRVCFPKLHFNLGVLTLGLIIFFLLIQIPFFGGILSIAFTFLGLGAILLARLPTKPKKKPFYS